MSDRRRTYLNYLFENMTYLGRYTSDSNTFILSSDNPSVSFVLASDIPSQFNRIILISEGSLKSTSEYSLGYDYHSINYRIIHSGISNLGVTRSNSTSSLVHVMGCAFRHLENSCKADISYVNNELKLILTLEDASPSTSTLVVDKLNYVFDLIGINE